MYTTTPETIKQHKSSRYTYELYVCVNDKELKQLLKLHCYILSI